jgi:hypothetical protein
MASFKAKCGRKSKDIKYRDLTAKPICPEGFEFLGFDKTKRKAFYKKK